MSIVINKAECTGCGKCFEICPGNLIRLDESGKAYIKNMSECWSCMACMKECKFSAINYVLSPELGGRGGILSIRRDKNLTEWTIKKTDGTTQTFITDTNEANKY